MKHVQDNMKISTIVDIYYRYVRAIVQDNMKISTIVDSWCFYVCRKRLGQYENFYYCRFNTHMRRDAGLRQYENFYYCRYPEGSVEAVV